MNRKHYQGCKLQRTPQTWRPRAGAQLPYSGRIEPADPLNRPVTSANSTMCPQSCAPCYARRRCPYINCNELRQPLHFPTVRRPQKSMCWLALGRNCLQKPFEIVLPTSAHAALSKLCVRGCTTTLRVPAQHQGRAPPHKCDSDTSEAWASKRAEKLGREELSIRDVIVGQMVSERTSFSPDSASSAPYRKAHVLGLRTESEFCAGELDLCANGL